MTCAGCVSNGDMCCACQLQSALRSAVASGAVDGSSDSAESRLLPADVCTSRHLAIILRVFLITILYFVAVLH